MAKWDNEELNWQLNAYPNAPCHTCAYRDREGFGNVNGGAKRSCRKYPIPQYSIGFKGKPDAVLEGRKPCEHYRKG